MNLKRFFTHWNLQENPFQAEEAKDDSVYLRIMEEAMTHPDFEKIYGSPEQPSTSVVFGEKGSGKTAMRFLIEKRIQSRNHHFPSAKTRMIRYDELNPMLDRLGQSTGSDKPEEVLGKVRLQEHQDAILSLAVTGIMDELLGAAEIPGEDLKTMRKAMRRMPRQKRIDLATLGLLYDQPSTGNPESRWRRMRSLLRVTAWYNPRTAGYLTLGTLAVGLAGLAGWYFGAEAWWWKLAAVGGLALALPCLIAQLRQKFRNWKRARHIVREIRVVERMPGLLARELAELPEKELSLQPIPSSGDSDSRYDLTQRLIRILREIGFQNLIVLVDRVDEPVWINGEKKKMQALVWPMFNNKFLQQENIGFKLLLPAELGDLLNRESEDFYRQARMDKQNLINPLEWTGATLYDVATRRLQSCQAATGRRIDKLKDLFEEDVSNADLIAALDQMRQPRDAFKFLYKVIQDHCQNTPNDQPNFKIPKLTLEQARRNQSQRVNNLSRGLSPA